MRRLSVVPETPEPPKRSFSELVAAIYEDPRVGHEARELLLAVAYAVDLAKREDGSSPLKAARRKLGVEHGRQARYDRLVADDAPRYEPPREAGDWYPSGAPYCKAPRLRPYKPRPDTPRAATYTPPRDWRTEDGVCGAQSHHRVLEKDLRTGWVTAHWFCKRHKGHADRVAEQVREQNEQAPEPIPNKGGLLPCYFKADWAKVYAHYRKGWTAPSYGLCADDWPSAEQAVPRGRLRVMSGSNSE